MSPKSNKSGIKSFRPVLSEAARDTLTELAAGLGFIVSTPSLYTGKPSVPDFLESLAAAYRSWEHKEAIDAFLTKRPADFTKQAGTPVD